MTAKNDIEKLAALVTAKALEKGVSFETRVEALKALKPYYEILTRKAGKLPTESAEGGPHFGDFQADMADPPAAGEPEHGAHPNGGTAVRSRSRRN